MGVRAIFSKGMLEAFGNFMRWHVRGSLATALWIAAVSLVAVGCVTTRGAKDASKEEIVHFEPVMVVGDLELEKLNDSELYYAAKSYFAASDYKQSARYFGRIADFHPQSQYRNEALYLAGVSHGHLKSWEEALQRFNELGDAAKGTGDALRGAFKVAEALYSLERYDQAADVLKIIAERQDLEAEFRIEALTQQGICEFEHALAVTGTFEASEGTLRRSVALWQTVDNPDDETRKFAGQAQYFIGEIYRTYYENVVLNADKSVEELSRDLEYKAELLLSAQGHYLRAIRIGDGRWATAAGAQIGGLYENLYDHMANSPAPKELNVDESDVYRQELRKKIRILITKAITIYERTLEAAERIGERNPLVDRTRDRLQKMKELLLAEATAEERGALESPEQSQPEKDPPPPPAGVKRKPRS